MTVPAATPLVVPPNTTPQTDSSIAELWRNIIPYDDLQARGIPEHHLQLGKDILPTLSAVMGSGPTGPKLIIADAVGKLATANLPYFIDTAAGSAAIGSNIVAVNNSQLYAKGIWAAFGTAVIPGQLPFGQLLQVTVIDGPRIGINGSFLSAIAPGDPIILVPPPTWVYGMFRKRRYDWNAIANPGTGLQATLTIPQKAGFNQIVDMVTADQINGAASLFSVNVTILDGVQSSTKWIRWLITQNIAGDREHVDQTDMGILLSDGNANTIAFSGAPPAGAVQSISAGGYYEQVGLNV